MAASYEDSTVDDLREQARKRDLPTSGTKPELVARLKSADAEKAADETAQASPLLAEDRTVDADGVWAFAAQVRALAEDTAQRLADEVNTPLADMETTVDDLNSGALMAGSRSLRMAADNVQRELRVLAAEAARLGQAIV